MAEMVKLDTARQLVDAGAVQGAEVIGLPGGWAIQLKTYNRVQTLATRQAEPRMFSTLETALKLIREQLGLHGRLVVDPDKWAPVGVHTRRRPDRSAAMRLKEADARYTAFLRDAVLEARNDTRPALSSVEAKVEMDRYKADRRAELTAALANRA